MENKDYCWDLSVLYKSFEDEAYANDTRKIKELIAKLNEAAKALSHEDEAKTVTDYLKLKEGFEVLSNKYTSFAFLQSAVDVNDMKVGNEIGNIMMIFQELVPSEVAFTKFMKDADVEKLAAESEFLKQYQFHLQSTKEEASHQLSDKEEMLYSKLSMVAGRGWGEIQSKLTSNLSIKVKGFDEAMPLSAVRNLAYDKDPEVRKNAYEAELAAYKPIEEAVAMGLNNIKRESNIMAKERGYKDVLDVTLHSSNMSRETLDAMIEAIKEELPAFRKYYKLKGKALGHENGLPFYDIFAPMGKLTKTYTYEEARDEVLAVYRSFSEKLYKNGKRAFDNHWIDVLPHEGKEGGAFCANLNCVDEARVMTNFTGQLSDIQTLAHELGHAYHDHVICDNAPLNQDYPMPLAETASILCQTLMSKKMIADMTDKEEKLTVVENSLQEDTQCVVDILSRYLFESKVCDTPIAKPLSAKDMCNFMLEAQDESYGDGLDHDYRHPYMWLCKSHYYSVGLGYYNWPYAFGLLYGKGLYAKYQENKEEFVKNYDQMLRNTGMMRVEDVAKCMGIDVTDKKFWISSLKAIEEDIDLFEELLKK